VNECQLAATEEDSVPRELARQIRRARGPAFHHFGEIASLEMCACANPIGRTLLRFAGLAQNGSRARAFHADPRRK
jgi:hypothetical protein